MLISLIFKKKAYRAIDRTIFEWNHLEDFDDSLLKYFIIRIVKQTSSWTVFRYYLNTRMHFKGPLLVESVLCVINIILEDM